MKMSVWWLSVACQQSVFQRYHSKTFIKMAAKANWHWNYVTFTLCIDIFGTLCRRHHLTCQNSKWSPQWGYLGKYMKYHSRARGSFLFLTDFLLTPRAKTTPPIFTPFVFELLHVTYYCDIIVVVVTSFHLRTLHCIATLAPWVFLVRLPQSARSLLQCPFVCYLPQLASFWKKTFNFLALCVWRLLPSLCQNMPTFCGYADVFTPVTLC